MSLVRFTHRPTFPSLLDDFFAPDLFSSRPALRSSAPALNVQEGETAYQLEFAVPGYAKEAFDIEIDNGNLIVTYENEQTPTTGQNDFSRKEFYHHAFKRSFLIPDSVDVTKTKANFTNGILSIQLPKKEEALPQPTKRIEIE